MTLLVEATGNSNATVVCMGMVPALVQLESLRVALFLRTVMGADSTSRSEAEYALALI